MGSTNTQPDLQSYSIPIEAQKLLKDGILANSKINRLLPTGVSDFAGRLKFTGNNLPSIPINWRLAESVASLKGLETCVVARLVKQKYGVDIDSAEINTDHASLFFMSTVIWSFADSPSMSDPAWSGDIFENQRRVAKMIPMYDFYTKGSGPYQMATTNIYPTKDGRWFHLHGSLNPEKSLQSIGLPLEPADPACQKSWDAAREPFIRHMKEIDSGEMQHRATNVYGQAGCISYTAEQFRKTEHGKANEHVSLFEIHHVDSGHKPSWWPSIPETSASRPLAGLKVVDLTRIIAAPTVTRCLAELGASVMRVTSPHQPDYTQLHIDLNWGKWNCSIDLKDPPQRDILKELILDADVVLQGYRPGVLDKYGFSQGDIIEMVKGRDNGRGGIISARENCYGWHGPWSSRTGWQQISDVCTGVSHRFGRAMGLTDDEPVTPVFPNSDYMTGLCGSIAILIALMRRAEDGGSYKVDLALNYYSQWLVESCGEYPKDVWEDVWDRNGRKVYRSCDLMNITVPAYIKMICDNTKDVMFNDNFFEIRESGALNAKFRIVKPITKYVGGEVKPGYNIGTRGNGKDAPRWPEDLMTEVVI